LKVYFFDLSLLLNTDPAIFSAMLKKQLHNTWWWPNAYISSGIVA